MHPAIAEAQQLVTDAQIDCHPFFTIAQQSRQALKTWVGQELLISTPFSQCLLGLCARIDNLHVRSLVTLVTWGEHGIVRDGVATRAHPYLAYRMALDLGVDLELLEMTAETQHFIDWMRQDSAASVIAGIAAIGVGSEQLIVPEYSAVRDAFSVAWPDSSYRMFLDANITGDKSHGPLMCEAANGVIETDGDAKEYLAVAERSIQQRVAYYDALAERCASFL